ncbi:MAG: DUF2846 domain-containing protein [Alteromonadales bacterium]|nr:DUF2846 domain-containing protein [Alteromonadales bacterium]
MKKVLLATTIAASLLAGCASVPMADKTKTDSAKEFKEPIENVAGIYVYRIESAFGGALKKDVWMNDKCIGETAPGVFFYQEVEAGKEHTLSTESEFSPNTLVIKAESGELYFYEQYIKMGAFSGGAGLKKVDNETGEIEVSKLNMAIKGKCNVKA